MPGSSTGGQEVPTAGDAAGNARSDDECMIVVDKQPSVADSGNKKEPKEENEKAKGKDAAKQNESGKKRKGLGAFSSTVSADVSLLSL